MKISSNKLHIFIAKSRGKLAGLDVTKPFWGKSRFPQN